MRHPVLLIPVIAVRWKKAESLMQRPYPWLGRNCDAGKVKAGQDVLTTMSLLDPKETRLSVTRQKTLGRTSTSGAVPAVLRITRPQADKS